MGSPASRSPGNTLQIDKRPDSSDNGVHIANPGNNGLCMRSPDYPNRSP